MKSESLEVAGGYDFNVSEILPKKWPKALTTFFDETGLRGIAEEKAWSIEASSAQLSYSTHGLFRYFGKFPPPIARTLISAFTANGDLVLDPMAGSGTTGVEALLLNRGARLYDINPLSTLISRVKTTRIKEQKLEAALRQITSSYKRLKPDDFWPMQIKNPEHWFEDETISSLRRLRRAILKVEDEEVNDFFSLAFASIVRKVSRATTQQGRLFLDVATAQRDALPAFLKAAERAIPRVASLPKGAVKVETRDAKVPAGGKRTLSRLTILHPPYFNSYSYSAINTLEMGWLNIDRKSVRQEELREYFKVAQPHNVAAYVEDLASSIHAASRETSKGGRIAVMMGDTRLRGNFVQVGKPLLSLLNDDLKLEQIVLRIPKFTEASWAASQRRSAQSLGIQMFDYLFIFKVEK